jgi:23S rRNA (adenine2503-C2)-methyltransferase
MHRNTQTDTYKNNNVNKTDIRIFSLPELENIVQAYGEPKFKAKQIYQWIWQKRALDFDEMTNLSKNLREKLKESYSFNKLQNVHQQISLDGTIKTGWKLEDDSIIESVLIPVPRDNRYTLCVSSQVGCSLDCKFCATGKLKKVRNLKDYEIVEQFYKVNEQSIENYGHKLTNIVYMGMGEPLLNYNNVIKSIDKITNPNAAGYSMRRITISTAGIVKGINRLADDNIKVNIALSLHAADDKKRNILMPINETNKLKDVIKSLINLYDKTKVKISYEYIMFKDFNDSLDDAEKLYKLTKYFPVKVNIIEYNYVEGVDLKKSGDDKVNRFAKYLVDKGVMATVRRSRGKDIDAACGQLANKVKK